MGLLVYPDSWLGGLGSWFALYDTMLYAIHQGICLTNNTILLNTCVAGTQVDLGWFALSVTSVDHKIMYYILANIYKNPLADPVQSVKMTRSRGKKSGQCMQLSRPT